MNDKIAIDPGYSGGVVWDTKEGVKSVNMPPTMCDICDTIRLILSDNPDINYVAILERVGSYMPGNSGPAAVKFARHCGNLEAILYTLGVETIDVHPKTWQKSMNITKFEPIPKTTPKPEAKKIRSKRKTIRKNDIKQHMSDEFSDLKVTLKTADALGMLHWSRVKGDTE